MVFPDSYTRAETDNLLAYKVSVGSNVPLNQMNLTSSDVNNSPLVITTNASNWFQAEYRAITDATGCLFKYKTIASSTPWWAGFWGANAYDFDIRYNYGGLSMKANGNAFLSGP